MIAERNQGVGASIEIDFEDVGGVEVGQVEILTVGRDIAIPRMAGEMNGCEKFAVGGVVAVNLLGFFNHHKLMAPGVENQVAGGGIDVGEKGVAGAADFQA